MHVLQIKFLLNKLISIRMKLNHYVALFLTLLLDAFLFGLGCLIIAAADTGGAFIFFIEWAIIIAAHKLVYQALTGEDTEEKDEEQ